MESRKNKKINLNLLFIIPLIILLFTLSSCKDFFKFLLGNKAPEIVSLEISSPNPKTGDQVTVVATAVDGDGDTLTYSWILKSRPGSSESVLEASDASSVFIPDLEGIYTVQCTVSDGSDSDVETLDITVITVDTAAPFITSISPMDGASNVPITTNVIVLFNEEMDPVTLNSLTFKFWQGETPVYGEVSYDEALGTATFDPTADLEYSSECTARVTTGAKDLAGNALEEEYGWSFTTAEAPDTTPPSITSVNPLRDSTGVLTYTNLSVVFSEAMDPSSITAATFQLLKESIPVSGTVSYNTITYTATFDPAEDLQGDMVYTGKITTGTKDLSGNALEEEYTWPFTTGALIDTTPPTVMLVDPAEGSLDVQASSNLYVTFSEPMDSSTINTATIQLLIGVSPVSGSVSYDSGTRIAAFDPSSNLASLTQYTGKVTTGVKDLAGNPLQQEFTWTFNTVDTTPPGDVTSLNALPGDGEVTLSWENPVGYDDFAGVLVLWKIGGAPLAPSDGTEIYSSSGTTCIHTGATNGQLYYYRAFSFDTSGNYSAGVSVSATPNLPPEQPSNLLALPGFTDTLLFWQPPANVDGVKVLRKLGGFPTSPTDGTVIHEGAANTATSTGLTSGNVYYYAFYSYRTGVYSEAASLTATPALKQDVDQSGDLGKYSSLALDSDGKVHISYYDNTNGDLKYITNKTGSWVSTTVESANNVGLYTSIAVDSNGYIHISYYENSNYDLRYATNKSGSWVSTLVDSANNTGQYSSIAVDAGGFIHIAYSYVTGYDLRYATNSSGTWEIIAVDSGGTVGSWCSLALDSNNNIHISYYDGTNYDLKYATKEVNGSFQVAALDVTEGLSVGSHTSLAVDSGGKVHISYYDNTNDDLKYITNAPGYWAEPVTVDSEGTVGQYTSIAVDSQNNIYIIYSGSGLKYSTNKGGTWVSHKLSTETIDLFTDLAIDVNDNLHISCYLLSSYDLRYIRLKVE